MRKYVDTVIAEPNTDWINTTLNTTEAAIWSSVLYSPIDGHTPRLGKVWRVSAGGTILSPAGNITVNVYYGTSPTDPNGGLIGTVTIPLADAGDWYLDLKAMVRQLILGGTAALYANAFGFVATGSGKAFALALAHPPIGDVTLNAAITVTMTSSSNAAGQSVRVLGPVMEAMD